MGLGKYVWTKKAAVTTRINKVNAIIEVTLLFEKTTS
jgi:hypothetical protein